jgi:2-deoxy-D-gluconate 3-dehydrogenase
MTTVEPPPPVPAAELISLAGRTAVVTGGAAGIGAGIAYRLAEAGAAVIVADVDGAAADDTAKALVGAGFEASGARVDVADETQVRDMLRMTVERYGGLDVLVNNAGIYPMARLVGQPTDTFRRVLEVNLVGLFLCTRLAAEQMIAQGRGGRIVQITSIDALHPSGVGLAHYDASKHGAWGFTKSAALELAPHGIAVNAIAPGGILTPGAQAAQASAAPGGVDPDELLRRFLARIPMGRLGDPDEIGRVALFLASDLAAYVTGAQIVVDGGALLA